MMGVPPQEQTRVWGAQALAALSISLRVDRDIVEEVEQSWVLLWGFGAVVWGASASQGF